MGIRGGLGDLAKASAARLAVYIAVAVVVGAAAGGLIDVRFGSDLPAADAGPTRPEVAEAPPVQGIDMPLPEAVQVVDSGFTVASRLYCNGVDEDPSDGCEGCSIAAGCGIHAAVEEHLVSYGVVVRNDSDHLLQNVPVTISFVDAAGQPVGVPHDDTFGEIHIGRLRPGEELGLGNTTSLERGGASEMRVEVGAHADWVSPDYARATGDVASLLEPMAADVSVHGFGAVDRNGDPLEWTVAFGVSVELPADVTCPGACLLTSLPHAIFRDHGGHIVAGVAGTPMQLGEGYGEISFFYGDNLGLTDIDPDQTQVYLTGIGVR